MSTSVPDAEKSSPQIKFHVDFKDLVMDDKTMKTFAQQLGEKYANDIAKLMENKRIHVTGRRFGKTDLARKQMAYYNNYITWDSANSAQPTYTITTTGTNYPYYIRADKQYTYTDEWNQSHKLTTWPQVGVDPAWGDATKKFIEDNKEIDKMEKCHLCGEDLVKIETEEWRELDCDCDADADACKCDEYVWKKMVVKHFACGTIKREGDVEGKRVTLGEGCIEIG